MLPPNLPKGIPMSFNSTPRRLLAVVVFGSSIPIKDADAQFIRELPALSVSVIRLKT